MDGKDTRIYIRTDETFKAMVEEFCTREGISVSDFIRTAAYEAMQGTEIRERVAAVRINIHKARRGKRGRTTHIK